MDWPSWLNTAVIAAGSALGGALIQVARWWWDVRRASAEKQPDFVLNIIALPNSTGFHTTTLSCRNNSNLPLFVEKITATRPRNLVFSRGRTDDSGNLTDDADERGANELEFEWECPPISPGSKAQWSGYLTFYSKRNAAAQRLSFAEVIITYRLVTSSKRLKKKLKSLREVRWNEGAQRSA